MNDQLRIQYIDAYPDKKEQMCTLAIKLRGIDGAVCYRISYNLAKSRAFKTRVYALLQTEEFLQHSVFVEDYTPSDTAVLVYGMRGVQ